WVLEEKPDWKDNYIVDMRSEKWHDILLERVIPEISAKGYRGLFLDTIDTASALYANDPDKYTGILNAPAEIIRKIKIRFPDLMLIPNNGLDLFDSFGSDVDAVFFFFLYGMPDFENGSYFRADQNDSDNKTKLLKSIRKKYSLPVFIVDYADENNRKTVLNFIKMNKKNKFKPYIAEKELSRMYQQDSI
ncbi:MAG: endo alpha-1,4 polygalactosaminidase, partial [Candidatus Omnitrophica bacterium]|nr:endo alpha-1,4 polygalactosaminidase [Candidatus Omnitrophota bacterium]